MNNWKTTLAALIYGFGKYLQTQQSGPAWFYIAGQIIEACAIAGGFVVATDKPKP